MHPGGGLRVAEEMEEEEEEEEKERWRWCVVDSIDGRLHEA